MAETSSEQGNQNQKSLSFFMRFVIFLTFLMSAGIIAALYQAQLWLPDLLFKDVVSIQDNKMDPQEKVLFDMLSHKMAELEAQLKSVSLPNAQQMAAPDPKIAENMAQLEERVEQLDHLLSLYPTLPGSSMTSSKQIEQDNQSKIAQLQDKQEIISQTLSVIDQQLSQYVLSQKTSSQFVFLVTQIKEKSLSNEPFYKDLKLLREFKLSPEIVQQIDLLYPEVKEGVFPLSDLKNEYADMIDEYLEVHVLSEETSLTSQLNHYLEKIIRVKTTENSASVNDIQRDLIAAHELMESGYERAALVKLLELPDEVRKKKSFAKWLNKYQLRVEVDELIQALMSEATLMMSGALQQVAPSASSPSTISSQPKIEGTP